MKERKRSFADLQEQNWYMALEWAFILLGITFALAFTFYCATHETLHIAIPKPSSTGLITSTSSSGAAGLGSVCSGVITVTCSFSGSGGIVGGK